MPLTVPEHFRAALRDLAGLSEHQRRDLLTLLAELPPFTPTRDIGARVRDLGADLDETRSNLVAEALLSLAVQTKRWSAEELGPLIAESQSLDFSYEQRAVLAELIPQVVRLEVLVSTSKALDLVLDHEHVFSDARILTDIRPIFGNDADSEPVGAAVVSTLSVEHYNTSGNTSKFQLALDEKDLRDLREMADRALLKTTKLKALVTSAGLAYFEYEEEDDE